MTRLSSIRRFATVPALVLMAAGCLMTIPARATIIGFDFIATSKTGPSGSGFIGYDDVAKTFILDKFAFDGYGSFDKVVSISLTDIKLGWTVPNPTNPSRTTTFVVDFDFDPKLLLSSTFGGTYADTNARDSFNFAGTWRLEKHSSVPEPGSVALLGATLLALGIVQYQRRKRAARR